MSSKYVDFFALTTQAKLHHHDVILHAASKSRMWVTAGSLLGERESPPGSNGGSEKGEGHSWKAVLFTGSYTL